jgi:small subunit ribosomal protein S13
MTNISKDILYKSTLQDRTLFSVLRKFKGIGLYRIKQILIKSGFCVHSLKKRLKHLHPTYKDKFFQLITDELSQVHLMTTRPLFPVKTYKTFRHLYGLPLRGQRTKTNASTAKKLKSLKKPTSKEVKFKKKKK